MKNCEKHRARRGWFGRCYDAVSATDIIERRKQCRRVSENYEYVRGWEKYVEAYCNVLRTTTTTLLKTEKCCPSELTKTSFKLIFNINLVVFDGYVNKYYPFDTTVGKVLNINII